MLLRAMAKVTLIKLGDNSSSFEPLSQLGELLSPFMMAAKVEADASKVKRCGRPRTRVRVLGWDRTQRNQYQRVLASY